MKKIQILCCCLLLLSCHDLSKDKNQEQSIESIHTNPERDYLHDPSLPNTIELIVANEGLQIFIEALMGAELIEELQGSGPFTIFAPSDDAFNELSEETLKELMLPKNKDELSKVMRYHIHKGFWRSNDKNNSLETIQGKFLNITISEQAVMINDARILSADLDAANGVIHIIDKVLHIEEL